jgi:glycosyltransferase involved in cell wall biosynthesis
MSFDGIALVSEEYPPYIIGGTGIFCHQLARRLSSRGISTTVFSGRSKQVREEKVNDSLKIIRMPCLDFPPRYLWYQLQNFNNLLKKLTDQAIIHSITPEVSPLCVYLKKKLNKRLVTSYHGVTRYEMKTFVNTPMSQWTAGEFVFHVLESPLFDISNRLSVTNSDHMISCSLVVLNELRSMYRNLDLGRSSVIPNGIDLEELEAVMSSVKGENESCPTLIYYGRFCWLKGITYLIEAYRLLLPDYPDLVLKMFGEGQFERRARGLVSRLHLEGKIQVLGQLSHDKLIAEIAKADAAVLPSLREGQPISVLEGMACKKPVVAFDLPFAHEYISDSVNGLLAKPADSKDLAEKIRSLLSDDKLRRRLGQSAYEYVKLNHNWDNLIDRYVEVYESVAQLD